VALRLGIGAIVAAACAAAVWVVPVGSTFGQPGSVHLTLAHGTLAVSAPATSAVVGRRVTVTVTVTDARGTGAGWALELSSLRAVGVSRVSMSCAPGSTCTLPSVTRIGAAPLVLRAPSRSGMGVIRLVVTLAPLKTGPAAPVKFLVSR
jgi:hypothetical protein